MHTSIRLRALQLRMLGRSYTEIQKEVKVSKSTLSLWLRDVVISDEAKSRLERRERAGAMKALLRRNKLQTHLARKRAEASKLRGLSSIPRMNQRDLRIVGAVLYWAEGYKRLSVKDGKERTWHVISFVNADPNMIRTFIHFLTSTLEVPLARIRLVMRLYPHINEKMARMYWTRVTKLPETCFKKTSFVISSASKGKRPIVRLPYGTLQVSVNDTEKFHYLLGLIEGVKRRFASDILSPRLDSSVS